MSLNLGVRYESRNGGLQLTVYCPFWMLNKTGLMLTYRVSIRNGMEVLLYIVEIKKNFDSEFKFF
jgi:hypothetical protein